MEKEKKKNIITVIVTIVCALLFLVLYNHANQKPVEESNILKITYSSGGGLITYEEHLAQPNIEISNDLTVTLKPGSGDEKDYQFKRYTIEKDNYNAIIKQINDSRFMSLPNEIEEDGCMDGWSATITVETKEKTKKVHIYCINNKRFEEVEDAIIKNINTKNEYTNYYKEIKEQYKND